MSKNSVSVQEFNKLYNNKIDFIIEKYENQYKKEESKENEGNIKNNNEEEFVKLKNKIKNVNENSIKEFNQISDELCQEILNNKKL